MRGSYELTQYWAPTLPTTLILCFLVGCTGTSDGGKSKIRRNFNTPFTGEGPSTVGGAAGQAGSSQEGGAAGVGGTEGGSAGDSGSSGASGVGGTGQAGTCGDATCGASECCAQTSTCGLPFDDGAGASLCFPQNQVCTDLGCCLLEYDVDYPGNDYSLSSGGDPTNCCAQALSAGQKYFVTTIFDECYVKTALASFQRLESKTGYVAGVTLE